MRLSYRLTPPLIAMALALAVTPALPSKRIPVPLEVPGGLPAPPVVDHGAAVPPCPLGQNTSLNATLWFFPSDDYYYTLFDPADCGCAAGVDGLVAHWVLYWPSPCTINVQTWIVKAVDVGGGCYVPAAGPDPPDPTAEETVCGPGPIVSISGFLATDHAIPLPPCACLANDGPLFVLFKIVGNGDCPVTGGALDSPAIVYDGTPEPCTSYNGFQGNPPADMLSFGFTGNTTMWVEPAACCGPTQGLPRSWGVLKTIYR